MKNVAESSVNVFAALVCAVSIVTAPVKEMLQFILSAALYLLMLKKLK